MQGVQPHPQHYSVSAQAYLINHWPMTPEYDSWLTDRVPSICWNCPHVDTKVIRASHYKLRHPTQLRKIIRSVSGCETPLFVSATTNTDWLDNDFLYWYICLKYAYDKWYSNTGQLLIAACPVIAHPHIDSIHAEALARWLYQQLLSQATTPSANGGHHWQ